MKIVGFRIRELKVPLAHPYALSKAYGVQNDTSNIVLEIYTDEAIVGYGESDPWPAFTGDTAESVVAILAKCLCPSLIGKDPTDIDMVNGLMDKVLRGNGTSKASIDVACHDILGKIQGCPVCDLIGKRKRDAVKCFWAVGGNTPEETANEILAIKKEKFWGCMIKIGTDWQLDVNRTLAAREVVGDDFPLIADANQGWDVETAIRYGKAVERANLLFFEQPVKYWDVDGLARIRTNVPMPISADEGVSDIHAAKTLVKEHACDYFSIKISKNGGITKAKEICEYANEHGIKLFFNSMLEEGVTQTASFHLALTTPNILMTTGHSFFSTLRLQGDVTHFCNWTRDGVTSLPMDCKGLGVEMNSSNLDKYTVTLTEVGNVR